MINQIKDKIIDLLDQVKDPEIPVLSVTDMGVIRDVVVENNNEVKITITPTYSGCPAMKEIEEDIINTLAKNGFNNVFVQTVLSPPWTTDWITERGKESLRKYGIAPPLNSSVDKRSIMSKGKSEIKCPQCNSNNTEMISQFGSTACKALYKCKDCLEPFDYFKCI